MVLRLDPRVPLVWRDPFSLQFGVEPARVVLRDVTSSQERLVAALAVGISPSGLRMVGASLGATASEVDALVGKLAPVLDPAGRPRPGPTTTAPTTAPTTAADGGRLVEIVGSGPTVDLIGATLATSGHRVTVNAQVATAGATPDLAIAVGHYVFDPTIYSHWLRRDIPHLPIVFADGTVTVGPLVEPGASACLNCVEFYRRDADARWSTLASQLWGRRSAAEVPLAVAEASALAARIADRRIRTGIESMPTAAYGTSESTSSFRIEVDSGRVTRAEWLPHPDCACCAIDLSAVRKGTDWALARVPTAFPPPPTRARVADVRG